MIRRYLSFNHFYLVDPDAVGETLGRDEQEATLLICSVTSRVAMRVAAVTNLIATVPRTMAGVESPNEAIKILKAPAALGRVKTLMTWHPRMQTDAAHVWLRSTIRRLAKQLS